MDEESTEVVEKLTVTELIVVSVTVRMALSILGNVIKNPTCTVSPTFN